MHHRVLVVPEWCKPNKDRISLELCEWYLSRLPTVARGKANNNKKFTLLSCFRNVVRTTISACQWLKQALLVDITLTVGVAPEEYFVSALQLPAEAIYQTNLKTFGKCESFTHPNMSVTLVSL